LTAPIDFHMGEKYYESQWVLTFFKISSVVFNRRKKVIQVWNKMRMSK